MYMHPSTRLPDEWKKEVLHLRLLGAGANEQSTVLFFSQGEGGQSQVVPVDLPQLSATERVQPAAHESNLQPLH
jgi:hypothetical protein